MINTLLNKGFKYMEEHPEEVNKVATEISDDFRVVRIFSLPCKEMLSNMQLPETLGVYAVECTSQRSVKVVFAEDADFICGLSQSGVIPRIEVKQKGDYFILTLFELFLNLCNYKRFLQVKTQSGGIVRLTPVKSDLSGVYPFMMLRMDDCSEQLNDSEVVLNFEDETLKHKSEHMCKFDKVAQDLYDRLFPEHLYKIQAARCTVADNICDKYKVILDKPLVNKDVNVVADKQTLLALDEFYKFMRGDYSGV